MSSPRIPSVTMSKKQILTLLKCNFDDLDFHFPFFQDIDKSLYVAEFHQEEENEES